MRKPLSRSPPRSHATRVSRRPELEVLEDRTVPSISGEFGVATTTLYDFEPAVASAANGMSVVVWPQVNEGAGNTILAQMYNSGGTKRGGIITVSSWNIDEYQPDVSMDRE